MRTIFECCSSSVGSYLVLVDSIQKTKNREKEEKEEEKKREKEKEKGKKSEKRRKAMGDQNEISGAHRSLIESSKRHRYIPIQRKLQAKQMSSKENGARRLVL